MDYSHTASVSAAATTTPAASNASPLAETGGAFPLTLLAPLAVLALGVLAVGVMRRG